MPVRSFDKRLPPAVHEDLDRRLVESGYSGFTGLAAWLRRMGYPVSRSSVHRYATRLRAERTPDLPTRVHAAAYRAVRRLRQAGISEELIAAIENEILSIFR